MLREFTKAELDVLLPSLGPWIRKLGAASIYLANRRLSEGDSQPMAAALAYPHACQSFRAGVLPEAIVERGLTPLKTACDGPGAESLQVIELSLPYFEQYKMTPQEAFIYAFHEGGHLAEVPGHATIHVPLFDEIGVKLLNAYRIAFPDVQVAGRDDFRVTPDLLYYLHDFHLTALNQRFQKLLNVSDDVLDDYAGRWKCIARSSWDSDQEAHLSTYGPLPPVKESGTQRTMLELENPMGDILPELLQLNFEINRQGTKLTLETQSRAARCYWRAAHPVCGLDAVPSVPKSMGGKAPVERVPGTGGIASSVSQTYSFFLMGTYGRTGWGLIDLHQEGIDNRLTRIPARLVCGKFEFQASQYLLCRVSRGDREPTARELEITDPADGTSFEVGDPIEGAISDTGIFPYAYFLFSRGEKPGPKDRL